MQATSAAAERAAQTLTTLSQLTEQFLIYRTAQLILRERIDRYRRENQTPVLRRASQIFEQLKSDLGIGRAVRFLRSSVVR